MAFESLSTSELAQDPDHTTTARLSQSGQMIGWGVYGGLVLVGFFFGIVTGYERPKTIAVARAPKEKDPPKLELPKQNTKIVTPEAQPNTTIASPMEPKPMEPKPMEPKPMEPTPVVSKPPEPSTPDPTPPRPDPTKNVGFQLTNDSFLALRTAKVPEAVLKKLNPLKDKPFNSQEDFVKAITGVLTKDETAKFEPLLIAQAPKKDGPVGPPKKEEPVVALKPVSFKTDVVKILRSSCFDCHSGPKPKGGVDLTTIAKINASKESQGPLLVPNKPTESRIVLSIMEMSMPPEGKKGPTPAELTVLRNWILSGAKERRRPGRGRRLTRASGTRDPNEPSN